MARMDELLQGARIILDNLYTTDNDLTYIIDMALKKVSTDAPILIKELKIDEPSEVINFGLIQNCIEDETVDCCGQTNQGGGSDNDWNNKINIGVIKINDLPKENFVISSNQETKFLVENTTGNQIVGIFDGVYQTINQNESISCTIAKFNFEENNINDDSRYLRITVDIDSTNIAFSPINIYQDYKNMNTIDYGYHGIALYVENISSGNIAITDTNGYHLLDNSNNTYDSSHTYELYSIYLQDNTIAQY